MGVRFLTVSLPSSYTQIMPEQKESHFSIVPFTFQTHCGFTAGDSIMSIGTFGWYVVLGFNSSFGW